MRAMQLEHQGNDNHRLVLNDLELSVPAAGQVLIDVDACAMCRTDLQIAAGDIPARHLPLTLGHQVVGRISDVGEGVDASRIGTRVGLAWIANACGQCRFCREGRENLCYLAEFTGWDVDGGYADKVLAQDRFAFDLSPLADRSSQSIAPLMCAGVIGFRALRIAELDRTSAGARLGLYGYGASARQVLQTARHWGIDVYVASRTDQEAAAALDAGALWAGPYDARPPVPLNAAITFAPVGSVIAEAVKSLERGGIVAINAIHLDELPQMNYDDMWWERSIRSVANVTGADVAQFVDTVAEIDLRTEFEEMSLSEANEGLRRIQTGDVRGSIVLRP